MGRVAAGTPMTQPPERWRSMAFRSGLCLVAAGIGWALHDRHQGASTAGFMVAYLAGGWDLTRQVWQDLRRLQFDTHFLMLLVVPGSVAVGAWGEAALLLVLFSASSSMEEFANGRTRREINALLRRAPKSARLLTPGGERVVPVDALQPGDAVRVTANEQVPVDLEVTTGTSACDESSLTGESDPIDKRPGDTALAGTINLWGVIDGRVLRPASDSALQRIIRLIETAQHLKAPTQRFTDRFGTGYTAAVLGACLLVFLHAWLAGDRPAFFTLPGQPSAFYRAMTLLVVLSPCALVLSVPSAILSAIAAGARQGILFRGGAAIENLAAVRVVALDKTGTLTLGELQFQGLEPLTGDPDTLLAVAIALARLSNHPVSRSLARVAPPDGVPAVGVEASETVPGQGVRARWKGGTVALGRREWILSQAPADIPPPPPSDHATETWVLTPDGVGRLLLRDELRPNARAVIAELVAAGLRPVMLTGDREPIARRMAEAVGLEDFRAGLSPEEKVAAIRGFQAGGDRVAMIGDGVNDAPSLAAADVSVAMGARGSDAAIEQAEVVLMHDRLENFALARRLSSRARGIIRQNVALSLGTISIMAVVTLTAHQLPLSVGVAAHEGSTVVVVLNSLRLLGVRRTPDTRG